jgi:hypothetical protein
MDQKDSFEIEEDLAGAGRYNHFYANHISFDF